MDTLPKCTAKSKQSGITCKNFAVKGKRVCWIHGGKSKGPKTKRGRDNIRKARTQHGFYSQQAAQEARNFRAFLHEADDRLKNIREELE